MRRFDLDQLVMLVLVLATAVAVVLGVASVQEEDGAATAAGGAEAVGTDAAAVPAA